MEASSASSSMTALTSITNTTNTQANNNAAPTPNANANGEVNNGADNNNNNTSNNNNNNNNNGGGSTAKSPPNTERNSEIVLIPPTPVGPKKETPRVLAGQTTPEAGRLLDGFLLLAAGGSPPVPEDVASANLASLELVEVADEDLTFFTNLRQLDVSDNRLSHEHILRQLGRFPKLANLSLACNSLLTLRVTAGTLLLLDTIDLSYNGLHGEVLTQLGKLPALRVANLTANRISWLPSEESLSIGFQVLETLHLDSNSVEFFEQWRSLRTLKKLRHLTLRKNKVKALKDHEPPGHDPNWGFQQLQELDLSNNDVASVDDLEILPRMKALAHVRLEDNPCTRLSARRRRRAPPVPPPIPPAPPAPLAQDTKGCHHKRVAQGPRIKMDWTQLKKVNGNPLAPGNTKPKKMAQLCVFEEGSNELVLRLEELGPQLSSKSSNRPKSGSFGKASLREIPTLRLPTNTVTNTADIGVGEEEMSEEELDRVLKARWERIQQAFDAPREEPHSFRRRVPFATTSTTAASLSLSERATNKRSSDLGGTFTSTAMAGGVVGVGDNDGGGGGGGGGGGAGYSMVPTSSAAVALDVGAAGAGGDATGATGVAGERGPSPAPPAHLLDALRPSENVGAEDASFFKLTGVEGEVSSRGPPKAPRTTTAARSPYLDEASEAFLACLDIPLSEPIENIRLDIRHPSQLPRSRASSLQESRRETPQPHQPRQGSISSSQTETSPSLPPPVGVREAMKAIRAAAIEFPVGLT